MNSGLPRGSWPSSGARPFFKKRPTPSSQPHASSARRFPPGTKAAAGLASEYRGLPRFAGWGPSLTKRPPPSCATGAQRRAAMGALGSARFLRRSGGRRGSFPLRLQRGWAARSSALGPRPQRCGPRCRPGGRGAERPGAAGRELVSPAQVQWP